MDSYELAEVARLETPEENCPTAQKNPPNPTAASAHGHPRAGPGQSPAPPLGLGSPARVSRLNFNSNWPHERMHRRRRTAHPSGLAPASHAEPISSRETAAAARDGSGQNNLKRGRGRHRRAKSKPSRFHSTAGAAPPPSSKSDPSTYNTPRNSSLLSRDPHRTTRTRHRQRATAMAASPSSVAEVAVAAAAAAAAMASALPQEQQHQQQARPRPRPMQAGGGGANGRHHAYSRKDKSLGLLCSNFVVLYNRDDVECIGLDEAAKCLGVERRRIYDIVNVLESVGILVRKAKNRYTWIGFGGVPMALRELKERALREKSGLAPLQTEQQSAATISDDEDDDTLGNPCADIENEKLSQTVDNPCDKPGAPRCRLRSDHRKEKSLGLLTQNFVKLFLTMEVDTISLDEAAKLLLGEGHEETNMRTKVRRLYDIANVLSSLNLIEKIHQGDSRKPAFRWLGRATAPNTENGVTVAVPPPRKTTSNKRAFGTELTNIDIHRSNLDSKIQKKAKLAPSGGDVLTNCKLAVRNRLGQGKQSGFVYGPFHPAGARKHELDGSNKPGQRERAQDWESLSASFRPQYQNQALSDLFAHYVEAWKTWYSELAQGSNIMQQHFGHSVEHYL